MLIAIKRNQSITKKSVHAKIQKYFMLLSELNAREQNVDI